MKGIRFLCKRKNNKEKKLLQVLSKLYKVKTKPDFSIALSDKRR